ncbi:synaptogenesis protein syg-2-like [Ptychodera flava]|uniref:synaptogenesis protein syg-2-like n=1 Tax=Ptychodera flava TaxID=63121 RepID=UPI00396A68DC
MLPCTTIEGNTVDEHKSPYTDFGGSCNLHKYPYAPLNTDISVGELPTIEGNDVLLKCTADGVPTPTYDWTQNGVELSDRNKYQINEDGSELTILSITKHEREYYNCTATNEKGTDATGVFIDVYYEPQTGWPLCEVHVETNENYIAEGDFAELTCKATGGNPPPHLEWYNNSEALPECTSTTDDNGDVTETVSCWTLTPYDNGKMYECKGKHDVTEETPNCFNEEFDVKFAPLSVWLTGYTDTARKGDRLELSCVTDSSNPASTISWYKNDQLITDDDHEEIQDEDVRDGSFHGNVTEGVPPSEPDGCTTSLTGYSAPVVEGDDLVLTCTSCSGNPTPIIEWFEDEHKIETGLGDISNSPGVYHGEITVQDLTLHLTYQHHGQRVRCESFNEEFRMENDRVISNELILDVHSDTYAERPPSESSNS